MPAAFAVAATPAFAAASKLLCRVLRRDLTALLRKARRVALRAALIADWVLAMVDGSFGAGQRLKRPAGSQGYCRCLDLIERKSRRKPNQSEGAARLFTSLFSLLCRALTACI